MSPPPRAPVLIIGGMSDSDAEAARAIFFVTSGVDASSGSAVAEEASTPSPGKARPRGVYVARRILRLEFSSSAVAPTLPWSSFRSIALGETREVQR